MPEAGEAAIVLHRVDAAAFDPATLPAAGAIVMFTADWCGYCHRFLPHLRELPEAWLVDASDDDDPAWGRFGLEVVPTVILFQEGAPRRRWAGALSSRHADEMRAALAQAGRGAPASG